MYAKIIRFGKGIWMILAKMWACLIFLAHRVYRYCKADAIITFNLSFDNFGVWPIGCMIFCGNITSFLAGKQKVHYTFTDGSEMVEEYDMRNYDLLGNVTFSYTFVILHNFCIFVLRCASVLSLHLVNCLIILYYIILHCTPCWLQIYMNFV